MTHASSDSRTISLFAYLATLLILVSSLFTAPSVCRAESNASGEMVTLSDEDLEGVTGGDYELALEGFDILIGDNEAGQFTMDIAQGAFDNAQGIFTTVEAVNSAVNLNVIVNIYLNTPSI